MTKVFVLVVMLFFVAAGSRAAEDAVASKFDAFCAEWMKKLEVREKDNRAGIRWKGGPDGVQGEFVGYSREHTCQLKPANGPGTTPIGKIIYKEVVYRQTGKSTAEAQQATPVPVEATEVTEIFRYTRGKWVY